MDPICTTLSSRVSPSAAASRTFRLAPSCVTHVLYHGRCPDGFGAAWAAWRKLGDRARYVPVGYDEPVPDLEPGTRVVIADFAYPRDQLLALQEKVQDLVVLDHHETARRSLQGLDFACLDMEHSGAHLSWDYFHPGEPLPDLIAYVEDRDIWRFCLPQSSDFSNALLSYPMNFQCWDGLARDVPRVIAEGVTITRYKSQLIADILQRTRTERVDGHDVPVVACPRELGSDICHANLLAHPDAPFAASYYDDADRKRHWQLRSAGDFDVSTLAEKFGGGGHVHAAAFAVPMEAIDLRVSGG